MDRAIPRPHLDNQYTFSICDSRSATLFCNSFGSCYKCGGCLKSRREVLTIWFFPLCFYFNTSFQRVCILLLWFKPTHSSWNNSLIGGIIRFFNTISKGSLLSYTISPTEGSSLPGTGGHKLTVVKGVTDELTEFPIIVIGFVMDEHNGWVWLNGVL